ncbi:MAG: hypothetical protein QXN19_05985 [Sulfolobales archaeon]
MFNASDSSDFKTVACSRIKVKIKPPQDAPPTIERVISHKPDNEYVDLDVG